MRHVFVGSVVAMRRIFYDNLVPFVKRTIKWVLRMWHGPHGPPRIQRMVFEMYAEKVDRCARVNYSVATSSMAM
jgi:hypothetical protein